MFLRNAWYVASWSSEVADGFLGRTILDEYVLLYRDEGGTAIAIGGRCPHRFAPLDRGTKIGSTVQCGYHGLRFDRTGRCVFNPNGNGKLPAASVQSYGLVERFDLLWIWMGDQAKADPALIPDFSCLVDSERYTSNKGNYLRIKANYQLMCDNLMDLSHVSYLHAGTLGNDGVAEKGKLTVEQHDATILANFYVPNNPAPPALRGMIDSGDEPVDHWLDMRWNPGCSLQLDLGITRCGHSRSDGGRSLATHILTPETAMSTHYFYGSSRTYKLNDPAVTEANRQRQRKAFETEDEPMIEAVQQMMGTTDLFALGPASLAGDAGGLRVRRYLDSLIKAESELVVTR